MFSYDRDEMAVFRGRRALEQASESSKSANKSPAFVAWALGRAIIGWLTVIIVIQLAVKYFGSN